MITAFSLIFGQSGPWKEGFLSHEETANYFPNLNRLTSPEKAKKKRIKGVCVLLGPLDLDWWIGYLWLGQLQITERAA